MKNKTFFAAIMILMVLFTFSCNQPQPKNETAETKSAPGDFDRTILPFLPVDLKGNAKSS